MAYINLIECYTTTCLINTCACGVFSANVFWCNKFSKWNEKSRGNGYKCRSQKPKLRRAKIQDDGYIGKVRAGGGGVGGGGGREG